VGRGSALEGYDSYSDVRYDEDYAAFYELNREKGNLPPPIDCNTLYNDMQTYMAQQQYKDNSSMFGSARMGNPNPSFGLGFGSMASGSLRGGTLSIHPLPPGMPSRTGDRDRRSA